MNELPAREPVISQSITDQQNDLNSQTMKDWNEHRREQAQAIHEVNPGVALFAFAAWLTCRVETCGPFGAGHEAAPMADLAHEFLRSQNWADPPEGNWARDLKPYKL